MDVEYSGVTIPAGSPVVAVLLERLAGLRPADAATVPAYRRSLVVRAVRELPARWTS